MRDLNTSKENTWCTGCGNFGILSAVKKSITALAEEGRPLSRIVMSCGIGCHGKMFDYLNLSGVFGLHGRALATAQGMKLANPDLDIICFGGDGDSMGEGLEHTLFAAKRNADITLILHNNGNYGLTTGQASPLAKLGYKGLSTPYGNVEMPFHPVSLLMEAGASFVARSYSAKIEHLSEMIIKAVKHKGFSFVEVLQPCVSYNNTYKLYNEKCRIFSHLPNSDDEAIALAKDPDFYQLGIFRQIERAAYHQELPGMDKELSKEDRLKYLKDNYQ